MTARHWGTPQPWNLETNQMRKLQCRIYSGKGSGNERTEWEIAGKFRGAVKGKTDTTDLGDGKALISCDGCVLAGSGGAGTGEGTQHSICTQQESDPQTTLH